MACITNKKNDRFILSQQGEMGFEVPAGIGCCLSNLKNKCSFSR